MEEKEYGRIVVLMKDGSEGSAFSITKDVLFGRDKNADIRIKLNSVSRQHAIITIQSDGKCYLEHLSKTNPTRLNGMEIIDKTALQNRDEISIGERKFIFETSNDDTITNEPQGILKAVALNDGIDDSITVDYSRKANDRSRRTSVSSKNTSINTIQIPSKKAEIKSTSMTISLPLEKLVNDKSTSLSPLSTKKTTTTTNNNNSKNTTTTTVSTRRSSLHPTPQRIPHDTSSVLLSSNQTHSESHHKIGLPTPVKRAIQSKRKSISWDLERLHVIQSQLIDSNNNKSDNNNNNNNNNTITTNNNVSNVSTIDDNESNHSRSLFQDNEKSHKNEIISHTENEEKKDSIEEKQEENNHPSIDVLLDRVIQQHQKKLKEELKHVEKSNLNILIPLQSLNSSSLQTPHNTTRPLDLNNNSVLNTPLKREIQSRRITRSAVKVLETTDSPFLTTHPEQLDQLINSNTSVQPASLSTTITPSITNTTTTTTTTTPENILPAKTPTRSSKRKNTETINTNESDLDVIDEQPIIERRLTRQSLKTPLKTAIQSRRKSLVTAVATLDKVLDDPIIEPERSSLKTPIKKAIQAKRKSYAAQVEALDKLALTEEINQLDNDNDNNLFNSSTSQLQSLLQNNGKEEEKQQQQDIIISQDKPKSLKTPLKKAIELRRKSLQKEVEALDKIITPIHNTDSTNDTICTGLQTPLKKAIHSRRKSLTSEINKLDQVNKELEEKELNENSIQSTIQPTLPLPLREAIESRKFNLRTEVKILDELTYLAKLDQQPNNSTLLISEEFSSNEQKKLHTPLRKALQSRRKSFRVSLDGKDTTVENLQESDNPVYLLKTLQTPLKKAIQARRKSLLAEIATLEDTLSKDVNDSFSYVANTIGAEFESDDLPDNLSILKTPFPAEVGVEYEANQLCSRLSIASFASTIGREENDTEEALAEALECFLDQPETFYSPRRCSFSLSVTVQNRDNLLSSIEKKGSEITAPISPELIADIMSSITDEELGMIDDYSKQLVQLTGMEDEEAYARCLDAYIQGVEAAIRVHTKSSELQQYISSSSSPLSIKNNNSSNDNNQQNTTTTSSTSEVSTSESMNIVESNENSLTETPSRIEVQIKSDSPQIDFLERKKADLKLIMAYADDLEYSANLRAEIAYGIALDTYLADPISFRKNVKAMKTDPSTPIEWIEYEEEYFGDCEGDDNDNYNDNSNNNDHNNNIEKSDNDNNTNTNNLNVDNDFDGETENESDEIQKKITKPLSRLPSPVIEEPVNVEEKEVEDSERLISGFASPIIEQSSKKSKGGRGRKRKEPEESNSKSIEINTTIANETTKTNETIEIVNDPILTTNVVTPARKRGRPKKVEEESQKEIKVTDDNVIDVVHDNTDNSKNQEEEKNEEDVNAIKKSGRRKKNTTEEKTTVELKTPVKSTPAKRKQTTAKSETKPTRTSARKLKVVTPEKDSDSDNDNDDNDDEMEEATAIICDGCDKEYFLDEVGLKTIPDGDWYCKKCIQKNKKKRSKKSVDEV